MKPLRPETFFHFCPKCGETLRLSQVHERQVLVCAACTFIFFQNPRPTVTAILRKDAAYLFCKRAREPEKGKWGMPGGFLEWDEDAESGLAREMHEELGIHFFPEDIFGIYSDSYELQCLNLSTLNIYYRRTFMGDPQPDDDVAEIGWFDLEHVPEPLAFTAVGRVVEELRKGR